MTTFPQDVPLRLVLASGSPRRRELLRRIGWDPLVRPVDLDETPRPGEAAADYVLRLAEEKAAARAEPGELVLAADTIVVLDGELLGKPVDVADARRMLAALSGREHEVLTGVAIYDPARCAKLATFDRTRVRFAEMSEEEIGWYVSTGEPMDKAGAYGIQECGALFVEAIEGNYSNVVGLPMPTTWRLLRRAGIALPAKP